jgi:hypothetical protein
MKRITYLALVTNALIWAIVVFEREANHFAHDYRLIAKPRSA